MKVSDILKSWPTYFIGKPEWTLYSEDVEIEVDGSALIRVKKGEESVLLAIEYSSEDDFFYYYKVRTALKPIIRLFHKNRITGDIIEDMETDALYEYYEEDVMGIFDDGETVEVEKEQ